MLKHWAMMLKPEFSHFTMKKRHITIYTIIPHLMLEKICVKNLGGYKLGGCKLDVYKLGVNKLYMGGYLKTD